MTNDKEFAPLREALRFSPDNLPLRLHLARLLMEREKFEEAENEFKAGLSFASNNPSLLEGLAECYLKQGKVSAAMLICEEQLDLDESACAMALYARALFKAGRVSEAAKFYSKALLLDPSLKDDDLIQKLGVGAQPDAEVVDGKVRAAVSEEKDEGDIPGEIEKSDLDFSKIGGMEAVKETIRMKIIHPLTNKDLYAAYGKKIGGGILLYGPPGCGKTMLARGTAGEIRSKFIAIGLHDVLSMWLGQSEQNLHQLFDRARRNVPCVLFFDEVDALAASRADMRQSAGRHIINQFLSEFDGVHASNDGLLIMSATNAPWHIDPAFRRPGRFDRIIFVPPPDELARETIFRLHLAGKPQEALDYSKLAAKTRNFSGADIMAVVDAAVEEALTQAMKKGAPIPLSMRLLLKTADTIKPSTLEWFATAKNYATYANESGIYDEILEYLKKK